MKGRGKVKGKEVTHLAWFDAFAKDYDRWYESKLGRFVDRIEKGMIESLAQPQRGEEALDLGAGTGNYSLWLADQGVHVTGLDPSREMLAIAREKDGDKKVRWVEGDAHDLPFMDGSFHLVISVTALEFMKEPQKVLREAMRVLKPGGRIVLGLLARESPWGELYSSLAAKDPAHLFAKAHLYREEEIPLLLPGVEYTLRKGLYLPPVNDFDEEEAFAEEAKRSRSDAPGAGFFAVRWDKREEEKG